MDDPAWATQLKFLESTLRERLLEVAGARIERIEYEILRFSIGSPSTQVRPTT